MNPQEQRLALARWAGYQDLKVRPVGDPESGVGFYDVCSGELGRGGVVIPDYLSDLNAVNDLEKRLTPRQQEVFADVLEQKMVSGTTCFSIPRDTDYIGYIEMPAANAFFFLHATAAHRCEALLRTLGLWKP